MEEFTATTVTISIPDYESILNRARNNNPKLSKQIADHLIGNEMHDNFINNIDTPISLFGEDFHKEICLEIEDLIEQNKENRVFDIADNKQESRMEDKYYGC